jgi:hypothetical protein
MQPKIAIMVAAPAASAPSGTWGVPMPVLMHPIGCGGLWCEALDKLPSPEQSCRVKPIRRGLRCPGSWISTAT